VGSCREGAGGAPLFEGMILVNDKNLQVCVCICRYICTGYVYVCVLDVYVYVYVCV
jgi:hypothetical protein